MDNEGVQSQFGRTRGLYEGNPQVLQELSELGRGKLVVLLTGPSGVGKETIEKTLQLDPSLNITKSLLYTSRPIGIGEQQDVDYHFISAPEFEDMIAGNKNINTVDICLIPVDPHKLQSGEGIKEAIDVLKTRMTERRRGESEATIVSRLHRAQRWLEDVGEYSHIVVNTQNNLSQAVHDVKTIILKELVGNQFSI